LERTREPASIPWFLDWFRDKVACCDQSDPAKGLLGHVSLCNHHEVTCEQLRVKRKWYTPDTFEKATSGSDLVNVFTKTPE